MARDIDISDAWTLGEQQLYRELLEATQGTDGKNSFIGHLPNITNAWALYVGGGDTEHTMSGCFANLILNAEIIGRFNERAKATDFIGLVLRALSDGQFDNKENIQDVLLEEMPDIEDVFITVGKETTPKVHFQVTIPLRIFLSAVTTLN